MLGRRLEARAKAKTGEALEALVRLQPSTARRVTDGMGGVEGVDGVDRVEASSVMEDVPLAALVVGDMVCVRPGSGCPWMG